MSNAIQVNDIDVVLYPHSLITLRRRNNIYHRFLETITALADDLGYSEADINDAFWEFATISAKVREGDLPFELITLANGDVIDSADDVTRKFLAYIQIDDYDTKTALYVTILNASAAQDPALTEAGKESTTPKAGKKDGKGSKSKAAS